MSEKIKIRLNGKEIEPIRNRDGDLGLKGQKEVIEEDIQFVKGLATGEVIHWSLIE